MGGVTPSLLTQEGDTLGSSSSLEKVKELVEEGEGTQPESWPEPNESSVNMPPPLRWSVSPPPGVVEEEVSDGGGVSVGVGVEGVRLLKEGEEKFGWRRLMMLEVSQWYLLPLTLHDP